jgi:hypothetical protein
VYSQNVKYSPGIKYFEQDLGTFGEKTKEEPVYPDVHRFEGGNFKPVREEPN